MRVRRMTIRNQHWLQGAFRHGRKRRCLVDAIAYVRRKHGIGGDSASWHIYEVTRPQIYEVRPGQFRLPPASAKSLWTESQLRDGLMLYNDNHCKSFATPVWPSIVIHARRSGREDSPLYQAVSF
jgi:hypothetical protein